MLILASTTQFQLLRGFSVVIQHNFFFPFFAEIFFFKYCITIFILKLVNLWLTQSYMSFLGRIKPKQDAVCVSISAVVAGVQDQ